MREHVNRFVSTLYRTRLKPVGFRRSGHTFLRENERYVERFQIQGSSYNGVSSDRPAILYPAEAPTWLFYVNVGIQLRGIPPGEGWDRAGEHASGRIKRVLPEAEQAYELTEANSEELTETLSNHILLASNNLPSFIEAVRARASQGLMSFLPPE